MRYLIPILCLLVSLPSLAEWEYFTETNEEARYLDYDSIETWSGGYLMYKTLYRHKTEGQFDSEIHYVVGHCDQSKWTLIRIEYFSNSMGNGRPVATQAYNDGPWFYDTQMIAYLELAASCLAKGKATRAQKEALRRELRRQ